MKNYFSLVLAISLIAPYSFAMEDDQVTMVDNAEAVVTKPSAKKNTIAKDALKVGTGIISLFASYKFAEKALPAFLDLATLKKDSKESLYNPKFWGKAAFCGTIDAVINTPHLGVTLWSNAKNFTVYGASFLRHIATRDFLRALKNRDPRAYFTANPFNAARPAVVRPAELTATNLNNLKSFETTDKRKKGAELAAKTLACTAGAVATGAIGLNLIRQGLHIESLKDLVS